jgi:uncharacterized membrane protein
MKSAWIQKLILFLLIAALVYVLAIWSLPRLIMYRVMHGPVASAIGGWNQAAFPAQADARSRTIVAPNPDLLYAVCLIDLRKGPVLVSADPQLASYWSIALYASNSDNYFVLNDKAAGGKPVSLWLTSAKDSTPPAGAHLVVSPSDTALLLMRVLVNDAGKNVEKLDAARKTLRCQAGT